MSDIQVHPEEQMTLSDRLSHAVLRAEVILAQAIVVLALVAFVARTQSDDGARVERLADGVYAIIHRDATRDWPSGATDWPHSNTGVIVGDDGVLVVDATYLPSRARADIVLIRKITDKPIRYLVNTHWHGDHTHGNGVYAELNPGLTIIGQRANRQFIDINLERRRRYARSPNASGLAVIASYDSILRSGRDSAGTALTPDQRRDLETNIRERRNELTELAGLTLTPPSLLFDDRIAVMLGKRRVDIENRGRANSPADVTVYLPDERILFTGDILVLPVPYAFGTNPVPWIGALRALENVPVASLVPGHGPVQHDHAYTKLVRELFEAGAQRVEVYARNNSTLSEMRAKVSLEDFRSRFVKPGDATAQAYWASSIPGLLEDLWACVRGSRC